LIVAHLDPCALAHLRRALELYARHLRADGMRLPEGLRQFLEITEAARSGQERTALADGMDLAEDASMPQLLTIPEAAERLRVGERTVRRYTSSGRLRTVQLGERTVRVHSEDLAEFMDSLRQSEPAAS
jgi:excisionase family DNA binding protein